MVAVPIKSAVLIWARKERGLSTTDAAERLGFSEQELFQIEKGERDLTYSELERIAQRYQFPVATLLMPAELPPLARPKLKDFRVFESASPGALAPETAMAIEEAFFSIETLSELREFAPELFAAPELRRYALSDDPEKAANAERKALGVTVAEQFAWLGDREAFLRWREVIERQGIFTYQFPLGEDDSRGFAIIDENLIPIIVVDAEDDYPARVFTLIHEYAHILLRLGGISNQNSRNQVEGFCNRFAACLLMPKDDFARAAKLVSGGDTKWTEQRVGQLASQFKVSKSTIALHLENSGIAAKGLYAQLLALWQHRNPAKSSGGIATHIQKHVNRLGTKHLNTVLKAVDKGILSRFDAYELTNVKPKYQTDLRTEVVGRRIAFGSGE